MKGRLVRHSSYIGPDWHGFVWVWHSHAHWRTGWIIFGMNWFPGRGVRFTWPEYVRNGL